MDIWIRLDQIQYVPEISGDMNQVHTAEVALFGPPSAYYSRVSISITFAQPVVEPIDTFDRLDNRGKCCYAIIVMSEFWAGVTTSTN